MELNALTRWESIGKKLHELGLQRGIQVEQQLDALKKARQQKGKGKAPLPHTNSIGIPLYDVPTLAEHPLPIVSSPHEEHIEPDDGDTQDVRNVGISRKHARLATFIYRGIRRFGKGFLFGYLGKLAFTLIPILIRLRFNLLKLIPHLISAMYKPDVLGYGAFLGGFLCLFESIMRMTRTQIQQSHRPLVAGFVAGLALFLLPADSRLSFSMFFLVRALEIGVKAGVEKGYLPSIPHADIWVMGLASSQIIWCWLMKRDALDPSYARFLDVHGGKPRIVQDVYLACHQPNSLPNGVPPPSLLSALNEHRTKMGLSVLSPDDPHIFCNLLHPSHPRCTFAFFYFLKESFWRALPVYLPVYLLPLLLFKHKALMRMPTRLLSHTLLNVLRSSTFLSMYCSICWLGSCVLRNSGWYSTWNCALAGFAGGCTVAIEPPGRRIELALYVLSHGIQAWYRCWRDWGYLPVIPHFEVIIFAASMSVVLTAFVDAPHLLRASYFSLLKWFFGSGGKAAGFTPKGHPSDDAKAIAAADMTSTATATSGVPAPVPVPSVSPLLSPPRSVTPSSAPSTTSTTTSSPFQNQLALLNNLAQQAQTKPKVNGETHAHAHATTSPSTNSTSTLTPTSSTATATPTAAAAVSVSVSPNQPNGLPKSPQPTKPPQVPISPQTKPVPVTPSPQHAPFNKPVSERVVAPKVTPQPSSAGTSVSTPPVRPSPSSSSPQPTPTPISIPASTPVSGASASAAAPAPSPSPTSVEAATSSLDQFLDAPSPATPMHVHHTSSSASVSSDVKLQPFIAASQHTSAPSQPQPQQQDAQPRRGSDASSGTNGTQSKGGQGQGKKRRNKRK